jgi:hypothetical protein
VTAPVLPVLAIPVAAGATFPTPGTEEKKIHFFILKIIYEQTMSYLYRDHQESR